VEESSEPESSDDKTSDMCKNDKKSSNEPFLGTTVQQIVTDNQVCC
jgi:hypothetical protein